jgi:hypothetical protein
MSEYVKRQLQQRRKLLLIKKKKKRLLLLALVLIFGSGAILFHKEKFSAISEILIWLKNNKPAEVLASTPSASPRGDIYDRNFRPLAATYETYALYARPLEMEDPTASADLLVETLGIEKHSLLASLKSERGFVWIAKGINHDMAEIIKELNLKGVYQVVETKRFYPNYETAAHAVGLVENDQGLDGIEYQYNTLLRGDEADKTELEALHFSPATEFGHIGAHLVLNLDLMIQAKIERFLKKRVKVTGATGGAVLLMDANTGGVLAMASYPAFNPNRYWQFPSSALSNNAISEPVYPGELALIFQQAAAINLSNEKNSQAIGNIDADSLPVLEPEILKRRKLSVAPLIDAVDPEYLAHFAGQLGFGQKPVTDIPLKDETPVSSSLVLTDTSFHTSALRLLTGFTAVMNNGKIVSPHLLQMAYPKKNPTSIKPNLMSIEHSASLHPSTSKDLIDFLAVKWLKINTRGRSSQTPMFFQTHRFASAHENPEQTKMGNDAGIVSEGIPRITQSIMLGAIPGREPKLTMIALLSYPDSGNEVYPDALEAFGNNFSVLLPDQDMIKKMLYVADQSPPVPTPDFWTNKGSALTENINPNSLKKKNSAEIRTDNEKNMPDVTGKSLRAGLQVLQHFNLDIKLVGSGRIVAQQPAAGAELKNGSPCLLQMQQEI